MSDEQTDPQPRPDNMTFVQIPLSQIPWETEENHSATANAEHDGKWIALRDIEAGEVITIDYGINF